MPARPIIHWFRRDLRLRDNPALNSAIRDSGGHLLPLYIQSNWKGAHPWTGAARQEFVCGSLEALASALERAGSRLIIRRGDPLEELERFATETGAHAFYYNRSPDPFGREIERKLELLAGRLGLHAVGFHDVTAFPPEAILTGTGHPFKVFTPYSKAWLRTFAARPPTPEPFPRKYPLHAPDKRIKSHPLPTLADWGLASTARIASPGESSARQRMKKFLGEPIYHYKEKRNQPAEDATSHLSADLRWGTLSIREVLSRTQQAIRQGHTPAQRQSASAFLNELIWREFFMAVLWHWPEVLEKEFQPRYRGLPWLWPGQKPSRALYGQSGVNPDEAFERWREGMTGFPIVDAGMRQLNQTGFLPNRLRLIVAMFLTKDLHLDWRLGEQYFMQKLTDGEIASNNGGWQWCAGTGADAAPYFRVQNPWRQTVSYDPDGAYIRQWVPELRALPGALFAKPPRSGMRLVPGYPLPLVDHARERLVTLEVFSHARGRHPRSIPPRP